MDDPVIIQFPYAQVEATLTSLSPLSRNLVLREYLGHSKPPEQLPAGFTLVLWLADALVKFSPVKEAEQRAILSNYWSAVVDSGQRLANALEAKDGCQLPAIRLALLDRHYVTFAGRSNFLNLRDGAEVDKLPQAPFESIVYDLTSLYMVNCLRMQKMAEVKAKLSKEVPACQSPRT